MTWDGLNEDQREHMGTLARAVMTRTCPVCNSSVGDPCTEAGRKVWTHDQRTWPVRDVV